MLCVTISLIKDYEIPNANANSNVIESEFESKSAKASSSTSTGERASGSSSLSARSAVSAGLNNSINTNQTFLAVICNFTL